VFNIDDMSNYSSRYLSVIVIIFLFMLQIKICLGNPIPVYFDPEPSSTQISSDNIVTFVWIALVFIIDFFLDILIIYGGIYVLDRYNLITNTSEIYISKAKLFTSVIIISLVGLMSELIFWTWVGGVFLSLLFIFLSFGFVSKYIIKLTMPNSIRMGIIGLIINIGVWIVFFSL
jgi:hypothetical protein